LSEDFVRLIFDAFSNVEPVKIRIG